MSRYLTKRQIHELLDSLNVEYTEADNYRDLKRMLFNEIPNYDGKKKFININNYIENEKIPQRIQNLADDLDIFNNSQPPQQLQPLAGAASVIAVIKQVNNIKDCQADLSGTDV